MFPPVDWILDMNIQHLCRSGFPGGSNGKESACNVGDPGSYVLLILLLLLSRFSRVWLCNPIDGSPPGSPVPGILQARTPEWVAISFSNAWKWKVKVKSLSRVRLFKTPGTAAHQAPPSMGSSRQEYCSGVPLPSPILGQARIKTNLWTWYIVSRIYLLIIPLSLGFFPFLSSYILFLDKNFHNLNSVNEITGI